MLSDYLPSQVNSGKWVTAYTLPELRQLPDHTEFVLPICSLTTPYSELQRLGQWLLPPLSRLSAKRRVPKSGGWRAANALKWPLWQG